MGARVGIGRALFGLARIAAVQGNMAEARQLAEESLAMYQAMGHYRAIRVRDWLKEFM